ncbi:MAG: FlgD immunoglobulin-like domain containing protein [Candidatus Eisenbacteria bacterium]|nr:FlgD immunoglobulin-like domain containing protein [Candidatus Eisenbacteria bacterium]
MVSDAGAPQLQRLGSFGPRVARGKTCYLVVWLDSRGWYSYYVYAARVAFDGTILDNAGIPIHLGSSQAMALPSVAYDGENFVVVWSDTRGSSKAIYASRVLEDGQVVDPQGIEVLTDHSPWRVEIASNGQNFLLTWMEEPTPGARQIWGFRLSRQLEPLDEEPFVISSEGVLPRITTDGTDYLVVWDAKQKEKPSDRAVYAARVSSGGVVLDSTAISFPTMIDGDQHTPDVSCDGTNYLVVWRESTWVFGARVSRDGVLLDPNGVRISFIPGGAWQNAVGFTGKDYLVTWASDDDSTGESGLVGARLTPQGELLDYQAFWIVTPGAQQLAYLPVIGSGHEQCLVAWQNSHYVRGAVVRASGEVLQPEGALLSLSSPTQTHSLCACTEKASLVLWREPSVERIGVEYPYGMSDLAFVSLDQETQIPFGNEKILARIGMSTNRTALASNGKDFLAAFKGRTGLGFDYGEPYVHSFFLASIGESGSVQSVAVFDSITTFSIDFFPPQIAPIGENYVIVWGGRLDFSWDVDPDTVTIKLAVMDGTGRRISEKQVGIPFGASASVRVACIDSLCVLILGTSSGQRPLSFLRIKTDLALVDAAPTSLGQSVLATYDDLGFSAGRETHLLVWEEPSENGQDIKGIRFSRAGQPLDQIPITIATGLPKTGISRIFYAYPTVTFDGTSFIVTWQDTLGGNTLVRGAKVSEDGTVTDSGTQLVSTSLLDLWPSLCRVPNGSLLLVWSRMTFDRFHSLRVWGKQGTWEDFTSVSVSSFGDKVTTAGRLVEFQLSGPFDESSISVLRSCDENGTPVAVATLEANPTRRYSLLDKDGRDLPTATYWLRVRTREGTERLYGPFKGSQGSLPGDLFLLAPFPNPLLSSTKISFAVPKHSRVSLSCFDVKGNLVRNLFLGEKGPGLYHIYWDGRDKEGRNIASGVYLIRLEANGIVKTRKSVVVR